MIGAGVAHRPEATGRRSARPQATEESVGHTGHEAYATAERGGATAGATAETEGRRARAEGAATWWRWWPRQARCGGGQLLLQAPDAHHTHHATPHCTARGWTALGCAALHCTAPHCTRLDRTGPHCTARGCTDSEATMRLPRCTPRHNPVAAPVPPPPAHSHTVPRRHHRHTSGSHCPWPALTNCPWLELTARLTVRHHATRARRPAPRPHPRPSLRRRLLRA